ncbi:MAG TPA: SDR family oxidoreductase [Acidimicrobiia bacterium]
MTAYFISGASSGLGAEMARQLVARGDAVAIAARRLDRLEQLEADLAPLPGNVSVHALDVTDAAAVWAAMTMADAQLGGLDVVVVNAGVAGGARLGTGGFDRNRNLIETNLTGALAQIEAALELFRPRRRGHIALVSSLASVRGLPGSAAVYSATKAALASLGESLRIELAGSGIYVTTLRPGYIRTELSGGTRFPYLSPLERGVAAMISAMDERASDVVVPAWPWRPLGWLLRAVPGSLIRRFM